ncbi:hypothetical protein ACET3Z_028187 [Daucus carota]
MDGWRSKPQERDEFGLPMGVKQKEVGSPSVGCDPFVDKMKKQIDLGDAAEVFDEMTHRDSSKKESKFTTDGSRVPAHLAETTVDGDALPEVKKRPRVCSGCKQLGHLIGACPTVKRVWVQKPSQGKNGESSAEPKISIETSSDSAVPKQTTDVKSGLDSVPVAPVKELKEPPVDVVGEATVADGEWTTVQGKKSLPPKQNHGPTILNPGPTPIYSALAKSLSKGQLKRARNVAGRGSPKKK